MKFTEYKLEATFVQLIAEQGYPHVLGESIQRNKEDVLIDEDVLHFLLNNIMIRQKS